MRQLVNNRFKFAVFEDKDRKLENVFRKIRRQSISGMLRSAVFQKLFFEIIEVLINESSKITGFRYQLGDSIPQGFFSQKVNDYLQKNIAAKISIKQMARDLNVSVSTMTHKYKLEMNCSPMQYLMKLRIDMAKGMILKGASMAQIALMTGLYDEYHLSKRFKRQEGLSPKAYKQQLLSN